MKISHWYGRLGNNIQQCAVGLMMAQAYKTTFESIPHDVIKQFSVKFGDGRSDHQSKFFYYQGPYKEVTIDSSLVYTQMREFCKEFIYPQLALPSVDVPDDTLVIHLRSGDVFDKNVTNPNQYVPNPYVFYFTLLESFEKVIVVTEPDDYNPLIEELRNQCPKVKVQSKSIEEDFATLMNAKHVATSGVGTFGIAAALCSRKIEQLYCTDLHITEHLNYKMFYNTDVRINLMELPDYIGIGEWTNSDEQRQFLFDYKAQT
tara:strand:+ start:7849 stop:8628 length:780 start_codon:yes stop_codon:yes gene_type:complete